MYKDYVILATTLLIIALVFAGIRVRKYNWPYLYFLSGIVIASLLFTDPDLVGKRFINILYPLFVPVLYIVGPGIYGSVQPVETRRNPWHIIHYLPMFIGYLMILLHWFLAEQNYHQSVFDGRQFQFETNHMFWPFTDKFILMGYPFFTAGYYLLTIRKLREHGAHRNQYILPVGLLCSTPILFDVVFDYVYGYGFFLQDPNLQRYLLLPAVFIIFWDVIIVKPPKPTEASEKNTFEETLLNYPDESLVSERLMLEYLEELVEGNGPTLAKVLHSRTDFVRASNFSKDQWETFFAETRTSWNFLKKFVRIQKAVVLMEEGFLNEGNVDELALEVGYSTRASLYLAFRQIMGVPLPEYRLEREI